MATGKWSIHGLAQRNTGGVIMSANKTIILMEAGFVFDPATHSTLAAVTANELAQINGYTGASALTADNTNIEDIINLRSLIDYGDYEITASGGPIGPCAGAIVYDDASADDTVCFYVDLGGDQTAANGAPFQINNITIISQGAA